MFSVVNSVGSAAVLLMCLALSGCGGSSNSNNPSAAAGSSNLGTNPAQLMPADIVSSTTPAGGTPSTIASQTSGGTVATTGPSSDALQGAPSEQPITEKSAFKLLQQASFGATEAGVVEAKAKGARRWLAEQFAMPVSTYGFRDRDAIHKWSDKNSGFCDQFANGSAERNNCWRDWYSSDPIKLDFFKQASIGTDQLRQRVAFALSQILVVSEVEVNGTYGLADYHQMLRDKAFTSYREVLQAVITHPVMGEYLNMVNNDASDPNENFARELLQLFSIGTCELNADGTLKTGRCTATYDNAMVREYAHALTGWTFPVGGVNAWCTNSCGWKNPTYLKGPMVPVTAQHDNKARRLLSGVSLAVGNSPQQGLSAVVDSLMAHPNIAPFVSKQLIQFFVTSNPTPGYVARVASAFEAGRFEAIGTGNKGDLKATIAAVLLDSEARDDLSSSNNKFGKLREPVVMMVSAIRALNGYTDGERMGKYGWGSNLSQPVFNSPSVFNFYAPDYPLPAGNGLQAPQFQLVNANTSLGWMNFANDLVYWWYGKGLGLEAKTDMAATTGTRVSYAAWEADAADTTKLIERLDRLFTGGEVGPAGRAAIASALSEYSARDTWLTDANNQSSWQRERVKTAAYLFIASPHFQVQK
jgi:uncharacterized protein (DUF1800 family)